VNHIDDVSVEVRVLPKVYVCLNFHFRGRSLNILYKYLKDI